MDGVDRIDVSALGIQSFDQFTGINFITDPNLPDDNGDPSSGAIVGTAPSEFFIVFDNGDSPMENFLTAEDFIFFAEPEPETVEISLRDRDAVVAVDGVAESFIFDLGDTAARDFRVTIQNFNPEEDFIDLTLIDGNSLLQPGLVPDDPREVRILDFSEFLSPDDPQPFGAVVDIFVDGASGGLAFGTVFSSIGVPTEDNLIFA